MFRVVTWFPIESTRDLLTDRREVTAWSRPVNYETAKWMFAHAPIFFPKSGIREYTAVLSFPRSLPNGLFTERGEGKWPSQYWFGCTRDSDRRGLLHVRAGGSDSRKPWMRGWDVYFRCEFGRKAAHFEGAGEEGVVDWGGEDIEIPEFILRYCALNQENK